MKETIKHQDLGTEFYTDEKCYITEISNSPDDPEMSVARARVLPGVTTRWHRLKDTVERYYVLKGKGRVEVGDLLPREVNPGDMVMIPAMCRQRIANTGTEDLIFLAICTPRFRDAAYENLE